MEQAQIKTPKETYTTDYQSAVDAAEKQMSILWFAEELGVDKDEGDVRSKLTAGERHGVQTVLRLFTKYELHLGDDFWGGRFSRMFPRPDVQRMANCFSFVEINIHAPFYDLINKTLNIATDEFYDSWKEDDTLRERMAFVEKYISEPNDYLALAAFAFMEGVVLYSSFSFLKSFNTGGHNLIPHITAGIDASAKDEDFHMMGTAWAYRQLQLEERDAELISDEDIASVEATIYDIAEQVYEHEKRIVDMIFEGGTIRTVTKGEILQFIRNRIDVVLSQLSMKPMYNEEEGVISEWFYEHLNSYKHSDFFYNLNTQYVRNWDKSKLKFGFQEEPEAKGIANFL